MDIAWLTAICFPSLPCFGSACSLFLAAIEPTSAAATVAIRLEIDTLLSQYSRRPQANHSADDVTTSPSPARTSGALILLDFQTVHLAIVGRSSQQVDSLQYALRRAAYFVMLSLFGAAKAQRLAVPWTSCLGTMLEMPVSCVAGRLLSLLSTCLRSVDNL